MKIEKRPWKPQDLLDDLQSIIDEEPDRYLNTMRSTLCMARDYLKEFFSSPPNDPLTLEQLREMDGEPVWLRGRGLNRWYIFNGFSLDGIPFFTPEIGYGKLWAAYRHKPEEIQHEGLD